MKQELYDLTCEKCQWRRADHCGLDVRRKVRENVQVSESIMPIGNFCHICVKYEPRD